MDGKQRPSAEPAAGPATLRRPLLDSPMFDRSSKRWNSDDDRRLGELVEAGYSLRDIGVALGRTGEAVAARKRALHRHPALSS
jgi:hypothetical protein